MTGYFNESSERIVVKGENAGYKRFLLFPNFFKSFLPEVCSKSGLCAKGYRGAIVNFQFSTSQNKMCL